MTEQERQELEDDTIWMRILKKYIEHVRSCEGTDFLDRLNQSTSDVTFTAKELEFLKILSA